MTSLQLPHAWGQAANEAGGYAEAEPLYQRAFAIREKALGPTGLTTRVGGGMQCRGANLEHDASDGLTEVIAFLLFWWPEE
jgi:hypothetical protein